MELLTTDINEYPSLKELYEDCVIKYYELNDRKYPELTLSLDLVNWMREQEDYRYAYQAGSGRRLEPGQKLTYEQLFYTLRIRGINVVEIVNV